MKRIPLLLATLVLSLSLTASVSAVSFVGTGTVNDMSGNTAFDIILIQDTFDGYIVVVNLGDPVNIYLNGNAYVVAANSTGIVQVNSATANTTKTPIRIQSKAVNPAGPNMSLRWVLVS